MSSENYDIGPAEVNTQKIALIGIGGALATFLLMILTIIFFNFVRAKIDATKGLADPVKLALDRTATQLGKLQESGRWVDQKGGVAAVPIDLAMDLALAGKRAKGQLPPPAAPPPAAAPAPMPMPKADSGADAKK